jgi:hypothetical protein
MEPSHVKHLSLSQESKIGLMTIAGKELAPPGNQTGLIQENISQQKKLNRKVSGDENFI